jgi:hypothetical protein
MCDARASVIFFFCECRNVKSMIQESHYQLQILCMYNTRVLVQFHATADYGSISFCEPKLRNGELKEIGVLCVTYEVYKVMYDKR